MLSVSGITQNLPPHLPQNLSSNVRRVNFRAEDNSKTSTYKPAMTAEQKMVEYQKERKEQKRRQNISLILSGLIGVGAIGGLFLMVKGMGMGKFNLSNLEFLNLSKDESIFDLRTTKSLHPKVKSFFVDMIEKGKIPEDIARRAGILGEGGTNSVLLLGGSGVGKTEIIKSYAKATNSDYVAIKLSDFANSYVNGTSKNITTMIEALIKRAKEHPDKQLVISLDEVDALVKVTLHDTSGEASKNRQSLLTGMDKLLELPNVKLFTSSNAKIESLDGAFIRRCGYNFEVPMPEKEQLLEALKFQMRKCEGATENSGKFFKNNAELDRFLDTLVERKCAFGDVKNICKAAKDAYALDMAKSKNANKVFEVKYLKDALSRIETTAGEKAEREGSFI